MRNLSKNLFTVLSLGTSLLSPVFAQDSVHVGADARQALSLTIYNNDLAMVRDTRRIDVPKGMVRLEFADVSAQIKPETSLLGASNISVLEQNFDFDLLTPQQLLEKAVGTKVTLVRINPATGAQMREEAEVLSANGGAVLKIGDRIEVLREDGLPTRVIFDRVPENLRAKPTLSMLISADKAGKREAELTYLTHGLSWAADYVGTFDDAKGRLRVRGWITLTNNSGVSFENAVTQVVAGDVRTVPPEQKAMAYRREAVAIADAAIAREETLFDYHLYTLPHPTTVANNQTKQVAFLEAASVEAEKAYSFESWGFRTNERPENAAVHIRFGNDKASGLGQPLPKGVFRIYGKDDKERPQFLGEDRIGHSAENAEIDLHVGDAFDVTVKPTRLNFEVISKLERSQTYEAEQLYTLKNARDNAVVVELNQKGLDGTWRILEESQPHEKTSANTALWRVEVPAKGEAELRFKVRVTN